MIKVKYFLFSDEEATIEDVEYPEYEYGYETGEIPEDNNIDEAYIIKQSHKPCDKEMDIFTLNRDSFFKSMRHERPEPIKGKLANCDDMGCGLLHQQMGRIFIYFFMFKFSSDEIKNC